MSNPPKSAKTNSEIGVEIKAQRTSRGWTLEELSTRSGVSIATISKVENGQSRPSFNTLLRIARCLQMNFVEVMEGTAPAAQQGVTARLIATKARDAESYKSKYYDYMVHSAALKHKVMVPLRMTIKTHETPPVEEWSVHDGEEFIFVLKGKLVFHTEHYAPLKLDEGDSVYIDSTMRHAFVSGVEGVTEILSICLSIGPFDGPAPSPD